MARIMHGELAEHGPSLEALNQVGAGVFVMVNAGNGKGRSAGNVIRVRALFADLDGAPIEPVLAAQPMPHMIVESSPSRYHAYWCVCDCSLDRFTELQEAIAVKFASDPKVKDLPRVMRLPGFWHQKGKPFQTRLLTEHIAAPYTVAEIMGGLNLKVEPLKKKSLKKATSCVPNEKKSKLVEFDSQAFQKSSETEFVDTGNAMSDVSVCETNRGT